MSKALPKGGSALRYVRGYERPAHAGQLQTGIWSSLMSGRLATPNPAHLTGNAGLNYAAWQLSRRGWHVMPTIRNARGSDLIVTNGDETKFFGVQSKALGKRHAVPLGRDIEGLRSDWWVITINANSVNPTCFVMSSDQVRKYAKKDLNGDSYWLNPPAYDRDEFREAWDQLGVPQTAPPDLPNS